MSSDGSKAEAYGQQASNMATVGQVANLRRVVNPPRPDVSHSLFNKRTLFSEQRPNFNYNPRSSAAIISIPYSFSESLFPRNVSRMLFIGWKRLGHVFRRLTARAVP